MMQVDKASVIQPETILDFIDGTGQLFHANSLEPFTAFSPELRKALRLDAKDVKENKALQEGMELRRS